ncbi:unnamed protein product [Lactuca saligna]|uniref:Lumazine-binding domain-containing protein n=1 Tax=Lactuca saligna TaxID=75948 RepID=A0AA35ZH39_LACSI|nr:unnamed protein product [Lactuca saligna]
MPLHRNHGRNGKSQGTRFRRITRHAPSDWNSRSGWLLKHSLIELEKGVVVNLERAVQPSTQMGGHFVQGHVDGTWEIVSMKVEGDSLWIKVKTSLEILNFIVANGFIAVDGTSLIVVDMFDEEECFNFLLVEYTQHKVVIPLKKLDRR